MPKTTKVKISAVLATYNEGKNIEGCIRSLKRLADEIVVCDGTSKDKTAGIATGLGAKVISTTNKQMFHINKNIAIDSASGDWIFLIDADERVSEELAAEIKETVAKNPKQNGFWVNRRNWFLGGYLKKGGAYPDSVIRLFRKGRGRLPEISIHEQVKVDGGLGNLKEDILHFADPSFARYLERAMRYTDLTALEIQKRNPGQGTITTVNYMLIKPAITFLSLYIRHRGYIDGFRGFVWALFSSAHHFYAYVKYFEKKTAKDLH